MEEERTTDGPSLVRRRPWTILALLTSVGLFGGFLRSALAEGKFGIDFGVFYTGGSLISSEGFDAAYDTERFTEALTADYFSSLTDSTIVSHFISTPTFGWFAQALSWLPFWLGWIVWSVAGIAALVWAVRLLRLPMWVALALMVSPAMAFTTILGQTGPFVLLLFAAMHLALAQDRRVRAGLLGGLLILKPPLALGYGLVWLVQARRSYQSIVAAAAAGIVLSLPTLVGGIAPWRRFVEAMSERADSEGGWTQQSQSVTEFLKLLAPQSPSSVTLAFWAIGLLAALAVAVFGHRRFAGDVEAMSAVAVVATVIGSPHLLIYDTFILLIPIAVAYRRGLLTGERAGALAAIYSVSIAAGPVLFFIQHEFVGRGVSIELPALLLSCWLLLRWDDEASANMESGSVPVLPDLGAVDGEREDLVVG